MKGCNITLKKCLCFSLLFFVLFFNFRRVDVYHTVCFRTLLCTDVLSSHIEVIEASEKKKKKSNGSWTRTPESIILLLFKETNIDLLCGNRYHKL